MHFMFEKTWLSACQQRELSKISQVEAIFTRFCRIRLCPVWQDSLHSRWFPDDSDLQSSVCLYVSAYYPKYWFAAPIRKFPERWPQCIDISGDYLECSEMWLCSCHCLSQPLFHASPNHFWVTLINIAYYGHEKCIWRF